MNALEGGALTGKLEVFGWRYIECNPANSAPGSTCKSTERTRLWALDWNE